jgi:hypothetical protein
MAFGYRFLLFLQLVGGRGPARLGDGRVAGQAPIDIEFHDVLTGFARLHRNSAKRAMAKGRSKGRTWPSDHEMKVGEVHRRSN